MKSPKGYLSPALFKKIIDQMAEQASTALVPFFRGESLLHPQCIEMMTYAKSRKISPIQLTTNASLMTEDVARALIDLQLDFISFSIDSIDQGTYTNIRKGGDLEGILKNIAFFCALKRKKKLSKPEIQVSAVATDKTADSIASFVDYWQDQVDRVRIYHEHSKDGNFGSLQKQQKDKFAPIRQPCLKPFTDMVIYWNGLVALCNHDWDRKNPMGDVNQNVLLQIWHNQKYQRVRDAHLQQDNTALEELCKRCDHWKTFYLPQQQIGELYVNKAAAM